MLYAPLVDRAYACSDDANLGGLHVYAAAFALGWYLLCFLCFMHHLSPVLTLAAMMLTSAAFTLTLAPLSWVVISEIFPNRVRGKAMSLATPIIFASSYVTA